jgi:hypothetical protein
MNCAEFQKVLPYIIESGGNLDEEEHLRTCPVCSDLVADLKYIADQAKLLVPMEDPSPRVWDGIRGALENGEPVRHARGERRRLFRHKGLVPWVVTIAALLVASSWNFTRKTDSDSIAQPPAVRAASTNGNVTLNRLHISESGDVLLSTVI